MRDAIARALFWVLSVLIPPRPGRHSAEYLAAQPPQPAPVPPWSRPWTGPTKEEAAAYFRRQAKTASELRLHRERRRALYYATRGVDLPYTYPGAPFPRSAFVAAG
ncbi:hypothetical protein ACFVT5_01770 [Streptomyces sp. NPDC058001]|uniref:hypothetical protein n=1 Tax=Streptomyces sp. NPDC058001 TaxID=3346300 RepID=UPI0036E7CC24